MNNKKKQNALGQQFFDIMGKKKNYCLKIYDSFFKKSH
jgi:hypothetical protein